MVIASLLCCPYRMLASKPSCKVGGSPKALEPFLLPFVHLSGVIVPIPTPTTSLQTVPSRRATALLDRPTDGRGTRSEITGVLSGGEIRSGPGKSEVKLTLALPAGRRTVYLDQKFSRSI